MYAVTRKLKALKPIFRAQRKRKGDLSQNVSLAKGFLDSAQTLLAADRHCPTLLHLEYCWTTRDRLIDLRYLRPWHGILTVDEAEALILPVSPAEIKKAIFDIDETKAPGPDGYSAGFYKAAWPVIGVEVTQAILEFFRTGRLLKQINTTLISLIPKVNNPTVVAEFRPISCCNVLYKAITKILVQRLRSILDTLISPSQNAFVPGRSIGDNILLAQELFSGYNQRNQPPRCALKVDLRKAYDTVEWDFLKATLTLFGFPERFIQWIVECVTTPSYSVCFNGAPHGFFRGTRGLRQGTLCPRFCLYWLWSKADPSSIQLFKDGLTDFAELSGLQANLQKSHLILSRSAATYRDTLLGILDFQEGHLPLRYLGLPLLASRLSISDCQPLLHKIEARIKGWEGVMLSFAGRVQLIKFVCPLYSTSIWVHWILQYRLQDSSVWTIRTRTGTWGWRKLIRLRDSLRPHVLYQIGDGTSFSLWHDPWHPGGPMICQFPSGPRHTFIPPSAPLSTVIWEDTWSWPHITDMESIDITHDLPTIHGVGTAFCGPDQGVPFLQPLLMICSGHRVPQVAYLPQISLGYNIWALCVSYARMDYQNHMSIYSLCAPLPGSAYERYGGRFSFIGHIITGPQSFGGHRYGGAGGMWLMLRTGHFLLHLSIICGESATSGSFSIRHALLRR
ncbi:UNVERIFIED_CONTAM: hypothetical protein Sradi_7078000 [Sesamum radiatum]|uniref:Reverse transcriptase domain-containing protein n=1 Tax=Sesamum radiatum TaxID=300843 RepID=A0AAW2J588_SESRA